MKKLLDSDWLTAVQFKCNTVQKMKYQCKLHIEILDYDWLINNRVGKNQSNLLFSNQARPLDGAMGHFRVAVSLGFEMSLSAQLL